MENYMSETKKKEAVENIEIVEELPAEDDTELLKKESRRRRKEGGFDDIGSFQGALCLMIAIGLTVLNIAKPNMAEELIELMKVLSSGGNELFPNPIDIIVNWINK